MNKSPQVTIFFDKLGSEKQFSESKSIPDSLIDNKHIDRIIEVSNKYKKSSRPTGIFFDLLE